MKVKQIRDVLHLQEEEIKEEPTELTNGDNFKDNSPLKVVLPYDNQKPSSTEELKTEPSHIQTDKKPSSSDRTTTSKDNNISQSQIKSMVQSEVSRMMKTQGKNTLLSPQNKVKRDDLPDLKKDPIKPPKKKKGKTTSKGKKSVPDRGFTPLYKNLQPLNISPNSLEKLIPFESRMVSELLSETSDSVCLFSLCRGDLKPEENQTRTLLFQKSLIVNDFLYIPVYTLDKGCLQDITFLVFNYGMKPKRSSDFIQFIQRSKEEFQVNEYVLLQSGKFYYYNQIGKPMRLYTNYYSKVLLYYLSIRRILVSSSRKLLVNPPCSSEGELKIRTERNEVCIKFNGNT